MSTTVDHKKNNKKKKNKSSGAEDKNQSFKTNRVKIRTLFIIIALVIEIAIFLAILIVPFFDRSLFWLSIIYYVLEVGAILIAIPIINSRMDPSYKVTWLAFMVINSVLGALFYLLFANKKFSKKEKNKNAPVIKALNVAMNSSESNGVSHKLQPDRDGEIYNLANYIRKYSFTDTYTNTRTTYFPWGEKAFPVMLEKLRSAKHYIFMEYFIIDQGLFWNSILDILLEKVKQGVEVRVIYDDLGSLSTLPEGYDNYLNSVGIKCYRYSPLRPVMDIRMNNRDHRKIMVIDGHTGFTGGINIADEYINEIVRFGKWKDNAIMLQGDGVFGLTNLFLSTWIRITGEPTPDFKEYLPARYAVETEPVRAKGYVSVYGSIPYTYETVGLNIYEMLCYEAQKTLDIATPYLILNKEMENAICNAAKRGVRVRLLTPHVPDKKTVFELTRANYRMLLRSGVEIYEYTPGFVHAKLFVVDNRIATVGTINLDYRSLFLHQENGCLLYETDSIKDVAEDFEETFKVSEQFYLEKYNATPKSKKLLRTILKIFAPLM